jgi:light-harvesting complex I chlorophyll a/b binding protein 1
MMKCVFLLFGAVCATTQLYLPHAVPMSSSAVEASQPDIHGAVLPAPGWSGDYQQITTSDTSGQAGSMGAEIFGAALLTGLLGRWLATRQVAPSPTVELSRGLLARPVQPRSRLLVMAEAPVKEEEKTEETEEAAAEDAEPAVVYSEALPFLTRRASLGPTGKYVGDVGFDPLGFTEILPIEWLREAEIKHARVSMIAVVGFVFTDFYHFPGFDYTTLEAHDACVASGAMSQLLLWLGLLEVVSAIGIDQMLRGSGREPGDFGFDPLGFGKDPEKLADLQMKELANGRLAMFAFGGAVTQSVLTGNSFPYLFDNVPF